jgi:hypothetical protein
MDWVISPELLSRIKSYYRSCPPSLALVPSIKFRHFRFRLSDGSFYKIKRKIRTSQALQEYLIRKAPLDVYYSTACWLNPHLLGSRVEKNILKNVMISCDLVFDIDIGEKIKTLEHARRQSLALNEFLEAMGMDVRYCAFSGSKGFHIVCNDPWKKKMVQENPIKRETEAIEKRRDIIKSAKTKGLIFDEKVTVDPRRIIRLPGTLNPKTGLICTVLNKRELESGIGKILKLSKPDGMATPRIQLSSAGDDGAFHASKILGLLGRLGVRPKPEQTTFYSTFITNNISKTRLKIPVLEFDYLRKKEDIVNVIKRVQSQYGLGDVFVLSDGERVTAFSLKAVSRRRVEKILFAAGSLNLSQSKKYGCTYTRVGKSVDINGKVVRKEPQLVDTLESELRGQASRPHSEFLSSLGVKMRSEGLVLCGAGKEHLELVHAIIE